MKDRKHEREPPVDAVPPYSSYKTFGNFIDGLRRTMPSRIDRSVMNSLSGSNQSHLLATLRYMGLITPTGAPTQALTHLAKTNGTEHRDAFRQVLVHAYPFLFKGFDLQRATIQEVQDKLAEAGASGDTLRKCLVFFLSAARSAGIPISPFLARPRRARRQIKPRIGSEDASSKQVPTVLPHARGVPTDRSIQLLIAKFPQFDTAWPNEIKAMWFEAFQELMKRVNT